MDERYQVECCESTHVHQQTVEQVRAQLPDEDVLYDLTELFRALGDSTRMRILYALFEDADAVAAESVPAETVPAETAAAETTEGA